MFHYDVISVYNMCTNCKVIMLGLDVSCVFRETAAEEIRAGYRQVTLHVDLRSEDGLRLVLGRRIS